MEETDVHINTIVLKPSDTKRGHGGEDEDAQEADYTQVYEMLDALEDELGDEDQVRIYQSELSEYNYEDLQQIIDDPDGILESVIEDDDHRNIIIKKAQSMITEVYLMLDNLKVELGEDKIRTYQSKLNQYNYGKLQQIIDDPDDILETVIEDDDHRNIIIKKAQSMITEVYLMLDNLKVELGEGKIGTYQSKLNQYNYGKLQQIIDDPDDILKSAIADDDHRNIIINKAQVYLMLDNLKVELGE
eukprot:535700_1